MKLKPKNTVWVIQGFNDNNNVIFMMICASEEYAEKVKKEEEENFKNRHYNYEIEDWAICGD